MDFSLPPTLITAIAREDAVDDHDVEVHVEVEAAAESLHEGNRRELGVAQCDRARPHAVAIAERGRERTNECREELRVERRTGAPCTRTRRGDRGRTRRSVPA